MPRFLTAGGHISFFLEGSSVRFAIHRANVARTDLQISSKLMRVARLERRRAVIQWLRDLPIRRKLMAVITATSAVALVLASGMLLAWDVVRFRADLRDDLETLTTIIADNTTASLEFNDPAAAAETLGALEAKPQITAAGIYRPNGELFAAYQPSGGARLPQGRLTDGLRDLEGAVEIVRSDRAQRAADRHDLRAEQPR